MRKIWKWLFDVSSVLFILTCIHFIVGLLSFVPFFQAVDDFFYEYKFIGLIFSMGGFVAGILGIILLSIYIVGKLTKRAIGFRFYHAILPIFYGILWIVYFLASIGPP